tara:strand:+ start:395 stop:745 length:351 start_codon:yes stop_codon:yes gene_type:complete
MPTTEKVVAKAQLWLETASNDFNILDVKTNLERIAEFPQHEMVETWTNRLNDIVKGTRLVINLDDGQKATVVTMAKNINAVYAELPDFVMPRNRTIENFEEKLTSAYVAKIKAELK